MLAGLLAFRDSVPEEVAEAFVPEEEARRAASELAQLDEDHPEVRSHILHANWHVPLRWFAAFDDSERILTEDKEGLRIRYESTLSTAAARLERALEILEGSWIDESVTEAVRELLEWLADFPEDGTARARLRLGCHDLLGRRACSRITRPPRCGSASTPSRPATWSGPASVFGTLTDRWTAGAALTRS